MTYSLRALTAVSLSLCIPSALFAAESQVGYGVTYSGGSLSRVKGGEDLKLYLDSTQIRLRHKSQDIVVIPARAITEISYGQEVHRRIGTAAGLAVVSLGIGAIVAFSKSKKHYIGITWADADNRGGIVLQADKNEYRGLLAALEGVSGKKAVDTDTPQQPPLQTAARETTAPAPSAVAEQSQPSQAVRDSQSQSAQVVPPPPVTPPPSVQGTLIRFLSTPADAEVQIDGEYWGSTPTADLTRLPEGSHTILVKKPGYQPWERKITLVAGDNRTIKAELEPEVKDSAKPRVSGQN